jgi:hypothetical protein
VTHSRSTFPVIKPAQFDPRDKTNISLAKQCTRAIGSHVKLLATGESDSLPPLAKVSISPTWQSTSRMKLFDDGGGDEAVVIREL